MASIEHSFSRYVAARKGEAAARLREGAAYAYGGDLKVRSALGKVRPVTLALEATLRFWQKVGRNDLLGNAIRVGERQFPKIHLLVGRAAEALQIPPPAVYVTADPKIPRAHTFGTSDEATILINGSLLDAFSDAELLSIIGHECAQIQNSHTVYFTTLYFLGNAGNMIVRWGSRPAVLALNAWARRAEITCDRAALICSRDLEATISALVKLAIGSKRLYADINLDDYLTQLREGTSGPGRFTELFANQPQLPRRIEALRLFAETTFYRSVIGAAPAEGAAPGMTKEECDAKVGEILAVVR